MAQKDPQTEGEDFQDIDSADIGPVSDFVSYKCISAGEKRKSFWIIKIKKSVAAVIPHFNIPPFRSVSKSGQAASVEKSPIECVFPPGIDIRYQLLDPILAYVESGRLSDLITRLPTNCNILKLPPLYKVLGIEAPRVGNVLTISIGTLEGASEFCIGMLMGLFDFDEADRSPVCESIEAILSKSGALSDTFLHHAKTIFFNPNLNLWTGRSGMRRLKRRFAHCQKPEDDRRDDDDDDDVLDYGSKASGSGTTKLADEYSLMGKGRKGKEKEKEGRQRKERNRKVKPRDRGDYDDY